MSKERDQSLNAVLGKGKMFKISDDLSLPLVPATLEDLEDAMSLWETWMGKTNGEMAITYFSGNTEAREAFQELIYLATGKSIPIPELRKMIRTEHWEGVVKYLDSFLCIERLRKIIGAEGEAELGRDMGKTDAEVKS